MRHDEGVTPVGPGIGGGVGDERQNVRIIDDPETRRADPHAKISGIMRGSREAFGLIRQRRQNLAPRHQAKRRTEIRVAHEIPFRRQCGRIAQIGTQLTVAPNDPASLLQHAMRLNKATAHGADRRVAGQSPHRGVDRARRQFQPFREQQNVRRRRANQPRLAGRLFVERGSEP